MYICERVGSKSKEDSKRLEASRCLQPEFIVSGLLLPFILDGVEVIPEFQILDYIEVVLPESVMPAVEKVLLKEIGPSTTTDLQNECASIFEAIRLLTGVVGTEHMRDELDDLKQLRIARIDQIDKTRAHWKSHDFKDSLLQASQNFRICWYYEPDKAPRAYNNNMDDNTSSSSISGARAVNSTSDTATQTTTSASASAGWDRCLLSIALKKAEISWRKSTVRAKKSLSRGNKSGEQPEIHSPLKFLIDTYLKMRTPFNHSLVRLFLS